MDSPSTVDEPIDLSGLFARTDELRTAYRDALPWPHVVVHGAFPDELLDRAAAECMAIDRSNLSFHRQSRMVKDEAADGHGPVTRHLLATLDGPDFRAFVGEVTGVGELLPDPTHTLAGVHRTPPGGYTKVHRDFRIHPVSGLHHRVNALLYLNREWPEDYGGELELWNADMSGCGAVVRPVANTLVIFETDDDSVHGLPHPVACPPDRMRLSIASYFYSHEPSPRAEHRERYEFWVARPGIDAGTVERLHWLDVVRRATPRPVRKVLRSARVRALKLRSHA